MLAATRSNEEEGKMWMAVCTAGREMRLRAGAGNERVEKRKSGWWAFLSLKSKC